jgi:F-type H+-transporting ATPase subunit gamma
MPGIKELKTRIKSISGTRKVTRAMQMVSAAKMRKSQDATMRSRTYAGLAWELIINLSAPRMHSGHLPSGGENSVSVLDNGNTAEPPSPFEERAGERLYSIALMQSFPKASKIAVLILTTNRGMVGSLNANLLSLINKELRGLPSEEADFITYGRKGRDVMVRSHKEVLADFEKFDRTITTEDIFPISELITKLYSSGKYQKVLIFYNHFVSTLVQKPTVKQLLPFVNTSGQWTVDSGQKNTRTESLPTTHYPLPTPSEYLFEPDPQEVLKHLLPRIIESQIYQTILESEASEQSARMVMMKNATEAAGDLISDLTLTFNKLRQNKITTELAEITAGKIALE